MSAIGERGHVADPLELQAEVDSRNGEFLGEIPGEIERMKLGLDRDVLGGEADQEQLDPTSLEASAEAVNSLLMGFELLRGIQVHAGFLLGHFARRDFGCGL